MSSRPPRFERTLNRQPARINPLAGAPEGVLIQELEDFAARRSAELDRRAEESGFLAGQQAAGQGAAADASERTIRGRAFNRGVLAVQQAAQQTDLRDNIERFELENERNPEAFDAKVEGLVEGLLEEADPRLQPFIQQRAADYAGRAKTRIIARQQAELLTQAAEDLKRGQEGLFDDATTAAFEGDILMIETRRQELNGLLGTAIDAGLATEAQAIEVSDDFERKVTAQEVIGNFDRLVRSQGPDAGAEAIARWQELKPSSIGLTADDHAAVTRQLVTLRNREISLQADNSAKAAAELRAETNLRQERLQDTIGALRDGFAPDKERAEQAANDIAFLTTTGDAADIQRAEELANDFDIANAIQSQVHRFRRSPAKVRADDLNDLERTLRSEGFQDPSEVALLKALQKTNADVNRALDEDPLGHVQREGLIEHAALDFSSAETLTAGLAARETDQASQLAGQPVGKLTAAEADQFAQIFNQAEIEEKVALLGVITAGSGEDAEATLEQIDSKGHQQMALLGSFVMQGRGLLARQVLSGQLTLTAEPGVKPQPMFYRADVDNVWAAAMTSSASHVERRAVFLDAAFAKYADLKRIAGDLSDIYQPKMMRQALEAVMPTARFNGRRVAMPAGVTERRFDDWTDSWDVQTFTQFVDDDDVPMAISGVTAERMLELVRDDGRLVELGNGRYGLTLVSAESGLDRIIAKDDGTPLMLEFPRPAE